LSVDSFIQTTDAFRRLGNKDGVKTNELNVSCYDAEDPASWKDLITVLQRVMTKRNITLNQDFFNRKANKVAYNQEHGDVIKFINIFNEVTQGQLFYCLVFSGLYNEDFNLKVYTEDDRVRLEFTLINATDNMILNFIVPKNSIEASNKKLVIHRKPVIAVELKGDMYRPTVAILEFFNNWYNDTLKLMGEDEIKALKLTLRFSTEEVYKKASLIDTGKSFGEQILIDKFNLQERANLNRNNIYYHTKNHYILHTKPTVK
jgi:hypothetical protein